jgi:hypothetical protein
MALACPFLPAPKLLIETGQVNFVDPHKPRTLGAGFDMGNPSSCFDHARDG